MVETGVTPNQQEVIERICRLRRQMLVSSYIYYYLDDSIMGDHVWQKLANELSYIQMNNPHLCSTGVYDEAFLDWDGTTGYHLPHDDWVIQKSFEILSIVKKRTSKNG